MIALTFRRPIADSRAYVSNPFGNWYAIRPGVYNYHSSIDIVFQEGSIMHAPIQSVAWGIVTYAERVTVPGYTVFGNLLVIKTTLPDGRVIFCRYAHHDNVQVKVGDVVHPGQYLADVSDAYGIYAPHLDFAISPTDVLARVPWDWPGADNERVHRDYVDPCSFIRERETMGTDYTALHAALANVQAAAIDMQAAVEAFETPPEPLPGTLMYATTNLNVRPTPGTSGAPVATLLKGDAVQVVTAVPSPWMQIVAGPWDGKYVSGAYLSVDRPT